MKHARFGARIEEALTDPEKAKVKLKAENCDISYPPIVQVHPICNPQCMHAPWHVSVTEMPGVRLAKCASTLCCCQCCYGCWRF